MFSDAMRNLSLAQNNKQATELENAADSNDIDEIRRRYRDQLRENNVLREALQNLEKYYLDTLQETEKRVLSMLRQPDHEDASLGAPIVNTIAIRKETVQHGNVTMPKLSFSNDVLLPCKQNIRSARLGNTWQKAARNTSGINEAPNPHSDNFYAAKKSHCHVAANHAFLAGALTQRSHQPKVSSMDPHTGFSTQQAKKMQSQSFYAPTRKDRTNLKAPKVPQRSVEQGFNSTARKPVPESGYVKDELKDKINALSLSNMKKSFNPIKESVSKDIRGTRDLRGTNLNLGTYARPTITKLYDRPWRQNSTSVYSGVHAVGMKDKVSFEELTSIPMTAREMPTKLSYIPAIPRRRSFSPPHRRV